MGDLLLSVSAFVALAGFLIHLLVALFLLLSGAIFFGNAILVSFLDAFFIARVLIIGLLPAAGSFSACQVKL